MFRLRDFYLIFLKVLSFVMPLIGNNFSAFSSLLPHLHISTSAVLAYLGLSPNLVTECLLCFDACRVAEQILLIIKKWWDGPGLGCICFRELATMAVWKLEAPGGRGISHEVYQRQALLVRAGPLPQAGSGHLGSTGTPSSGKCAPSWR